MRHGNGHGGNVYQFSRKNMEKADILDFSANINPLGPPTWLRGTISRALSEVIHYPDPDCYDFVSAIADHFKVDKNSIVPGNGTTELLYALPRLLPCKRAVIPVPSYIDYQKVMEQNGKEVFVFPLLPENNFSLDFDLLSKLLTGGEAVILGTPNNPTGELLSHKNIIQIAQQFSSCWFIVDEAFLDFAESGRSVAGSCDNIITLHSLTKFFALPGLRLGFGVFPLSLADKMRNLLPPWTVNSLAQAVGKHLFTDAAYRKKTLQHMGVLRGKMYQELQRFAEVKVFPTAANYFLLQILSSFDAHALADHLLQVNIVVRVCSNYVGLDRKYFRVAIRTEEENERLIEGLRSFFRHTGRPKKKKNEPFRSLMIQGTSSNAGKSVIVAALCRILIQDGIRVAPFKAQNMSLNSFVTHDGLEMGRAQVVQAQAAKLDPDVRMNPILLKPNSDVGSQVIVHGKPVGNMSVRQYVEYKNTVKRMARQSFDSLQSEFDAIVLEGAGSPGEVNLKHHDIVNMEMARYARSPVLLAGDIDRGGIYASFVGTMEVLEEWERKLVSGFLVNRFRGDESLLAPAHQYVMNHTGKPVLGTIPYIKNLNIPEEDSVSFKEGKLQRNRPCDEHVEIALINLPHISNFTDIEPFLDEPDVYLKIVHSVDDLRSPQAILIPGSKNVMGDLEYLKDSGLGRVIEKFALSGCEIVGICGGYQILGKTVTDPYSIESDNGAKEGLGLLDIETALAAEKTLIRREGRHLLSNIAIHGYEIHHGLSGGSLTSLFQFTDGSTCGASHSSLPIWGAYLHGIFDSDMFRRWFIDNLREKAGMRRVEKIMAPYDLESAFDNLAAVVRKSIDIDTIYSLLRL
ncbi:MAG: cobyric acid synthase [Desulfopila sp.]|jgi:cobyric acid synthase CobQ/L-threonine-O-3-phosphate decarboxylase|nr:cobyric acid synthase [Desulfopila sp.]